MMRDETLHVLPKERVLSARVGPAFDHSKGDCFKDECFVLVHADDPGLGEVTVDTSLWAYKHIRQRPHYWEEKRLLIRRIVDTTNKRIVQGRMKLPDRHTGVSLCVVIVGKRNVWVGGVGEFVIFIAKATEWLHLSTKRDQTILLGLEKKCSKPIIFRRRFVTGSRLMVSSALPESSLSRILSIDLSRLGDKETFVKTVSEEVHSDTQWGWIIQKEPIVYPKLPI